MKRNDTKKIIFIAMLISISVVFSIIDRYVSSFIFVFLPSVKIGIANIVILIALLRFDFKTCLIMSILKSCLVGLILGSITTFIIGGSATIISFLMMYLIKRITKEKVSIIGISVIGGFFHITTQLLVISLLYDLGNVVMIYGAPLILISLITSIIIGIIANLINNKFDVILNNNL